MRDHRFRIVSFYTPQYRPIAEAHLLRTMREHGIDESGVVEMASLGSWVKNCAMKAGFIRTALSVYNTSVLWIDADAEIHGDLSDFNYLAAHDIGISVLRPTAAQLKAWPLVNSTTLSGTVFATPRARPVLEYWERYCAENANELDQEHLGRAIDTCGGFTHLDPRYCCIPDLMPDVRDPVIIHRQASRRMREIVS